MRSPELPKERVFFVGEPSASPGVGEVGGEAGLREPVRVKRSVDLVMVYFVPPVAERVEEGTTEVTTVSEFP